tara:strand:- start:66 stop:338 length:273 start_codon:yes stop_codon:yes gene_type:complete
MRYINPKTIDLPKMKDTRVDVITIGASTFSFLVNQITNAVYYSESGLKGLKELYIDFKYIAKNMNIVKMYVPLSMKDKVSMVGEATYYEY